MNGRNPVKMIPTISKTMAGFLVCLLFMQSCSFLREMTALKKCEFRMTTLEDPRLAGVDVSRVRSFGDIGMADMGSISMSIMKGELPLSFTLNVEARNPNPAMAALNRIEYIAFIDDVEVATGAMDKRIEIPPNGGVATIPIPLQTDLLEVLSGDSRQALINFGLNLADAGDRPTRVGLKVKPTILIGSLAIDYPGYLAVSYEFSTGN